MKRTIALAGNPNCGKTSLFNELTGANQYVGNWPGVTVEKVTGRLREHEEIVLQDLPGIYSLSPYTPEERVTRRYLLEEKPDIVVNVVDATNLERNLYLTTQLIETGLPVVVALNMIDLAESRGRSLDAAALGKALGCPVVKTSALNRKGLTELVEVLVQDGPPAPALPVDYAPCVEEAVAAIRGEYACTRLQAVKMLEGDTDFLSHLDLAARHAVEEKRLTVEKKMEDDISSVIAAGRYDAIGAMTPAVAAKTGESKAGFSDRLDALLTHRLAGPAIFVLVMWLVYHISINTVGTWGTDWANDVFFGEYVSGWLDGLLGTAAAGLGDMVHIGTVLAMILVFPVTLRRLHDLGRSGCWLYIVIAPYLLEYTFPHMPEALHTVLLFVLYVANAALLPVCLLTPGGKGGNKFGHAPARPVARHPMRLDGRATRTEYLFYMVLMSAIAFATAYAGGHACLDCSPQVDSLVRDGIVSGVGSVLGFLPQMAVLFLLLSLLEDCGYMARVAFMMDRIFRFIGLSGKSFIPLMVAMGCGVPAIMSTRTIENEKDRRMSVMLTTFIPCGAKLPIIALFAALLGQDSLVATGAYFAGICSVILGGVMLRKTHMFAGSYTPFVMELPPYHMPRGANINLRAMERCKAFVRKAGTVIFLASALIWFTGNYNWRLQYLGEEEDRMEKSILADVGNGFAPVFSPLGWGDWRSAVASVTGLVAKENVIATMGVLYSAGEEEEEGKPEEAGEPESVALLPKFNAFSALETAAWYVAAPDAARLLEPEAGPEEEEDEDAEAKGIAARLAEAGAFPTTGAALSFMLFNLLCAPCFAACGAIRREMNSARWTFFAIGYMCGWAYIVGLVTYRMELWVNHGVFGAGTVAALALCLCVLFQVFRPAPKPRRN